MSIGRKKNKAKDSGAMRIRQLVIAAILASVSGSMAQAAEPPTPPGVTYKSDIPADKRRAFFGELHLHTGESFDAWTFGSKVTPDQAYKFGRGETVMVPASQVNAEQGLNEDHDVPAKRAWPLDFMAVTDHSEFMGVLNHLDDPNNPVRDLPQSKQVIENPGLAFSIVRGNKRGVSPAVGNTVDLKTGQYSNTIGAPILTAEWTEPEFDPAKPAVYYARVLEIPTPRWSTLLALKNDLPIPDDAPATLQERAWTSPVWYTPIWYTPIAH
jgi:hypothetical protein